MPKPFKNPGYKPRQDVHGHWRGWGWFIVPDWNLTIAAPPKAGSSSLKKFFYDSSMDNVEMVPRFRVNPNGELYFIVRNPIDRFASLWRSKCRDRHNIRNYAVHGMEPDQLMEYILAGNTDVHWAPQVQLLGDLDAKLLPLDMLGFWWKQSNLGELPKLNATEGEMDIDDKLTEQIKIQYADDLALYHKAQCDFCWDTILNKD